MSCGGKAGLDSIDKVIWVLPFLAILDVISTLYVANLGYSLELYETGVFARFFVSVGLVYFYIPFYLLVISALAYVLWYIKNRKLNPTSLIDKGIFLFLVGGACYVYMRLTEAFIGNFLLPHFIAGEISRFSVVLLIYLSTAFTLILYLWKDVVKWVKANDSEKR